MDPAPQEIPEKLVHSPPRSTLKKSRPGPGSHSTPMPKGHVEAIESQMVNRAPTVSVASVSILIDLSQPILKLSVCLSRCLFLC